VGCPTPSAAATAEAWDGFRQRLSLLHTVHQNAPGVCIVRVHSLLACQLHCLVSVVRCRQCCVDVSLGLEREWLAAQGHGRWLGGGDDDARLGGDDSGEVIVVVAWLEATCRSTCIQTLPYNWARGQPSDSRGDAPQAKTMVFHIGAQMLSTPDLFDEANAALDLLPVSPCPTHAAAASAKPKAGHFLRAGNGRDCDARGARGASSSACRHAPAGGRSSGRAWVASALCKEQPYH
jgi:hypothetical protein